MKNNFLIILIFASMIQLFSFGIVSKNNEAVESIKDSLLYNAEEKLLEGLKKNPDNPILNYNYALAKLRQFEDYKDKSGLEEAIKSFEKAKEDTTRSNLQAILYNQANAYYYNKDFANAVNSYQESATYLDSTKVDPDLQYNYANSLYKFIEDKSEFDSLYTMVEDIYKGTLANVDKNHKQKIWHNLGNTAFQQENYKDAISYYIEALKLDPSSEDTRINYEIALQKLAEQEGKNQANSDNNSDGEDKQSGQEEQKEEENQQEQQNKNKQEQYDDLSDEEKEKLEAEKKLDALLQEQSRSEDNENKAKIRQQRPSGRYW